MTRLRATSLIAMLSTGLLLGVLCVVTGYVVVGMGHGWGLPAQYGFLSLVLYPLAMARWGWIDRDTPWSRDVALTAVLGLITLALCADLDVAGPPPFPGVEVVALALPVLYWLVGRALRPRRLQAAFADGAWLAVGVALDLAALADLRATTDPVPPLALMVPWLLLWLGWQAVLAAALAGHLRTGWSATLG